MHSRTSRFADYAVPTDIPALGPGTIPSPLASGSFVAGRVPFLLDGELVDELRGQEPVVAWFEPAGPREKLYFDAPKTTCAIVTCGGLCPGINDVIRAVVLEACCNYGIARVLGIRYGLEGFIPRFGHTGMELTPQVVADIHQFGGSILGTSRGSQPAGEIVDALERMHVNVLFVVGGDGTMKALKGIHEEVRSRNLRLSLIGIPKTIDNDINFIAQSFGFETAVFKAAEAIQCAHVEALGFRNAVGVVKLMGRESGFIAAQAAMALQDVDFVLIPEESFTLRGPGGILPALAARLRKNRHVVVVAAEGAGQDLIAATNRRDASGNIIFEDIGAFLCGEIREYLRTEGVTPAMKYIDPSYIIRAIPANANDRVYCGFLGQNAVHAAMAGKTGMVVAKLMDRYVHLPVDLVTRKRRRVDIHSRYWRSVLESTGQTAFGNEDLRPEPA